MTSPFGCSITQTVNSNYRQVFSFSLFIKLFFKTRLLYLQKDIIFFF